MVGGARVRVGVLLVHVRGVVDARGVSVDVAVVIAAGVVHLLTMMAARARVGVVVNVLVVGASGRVVCGAVGADSVVGGRGGVAVAVGHFFE